MHNMNRIVSKTAISRVKYVSMLDATAFNNPEELESNGFI